VEKNHPLNQTWRWFIRSWLDEIESWSQKHPGRTWHSETSQMFQKSLQSFVSSWNHCLMFYLMIFTESFGSGDFLGNQVQLSPKIWEMLPRTSSYLVSSQEPLRIPPLVKTKLANHIWAVISWSCIDSVGDVKTKEHIWVFQKIVGFPPKSSILIGVSIIKYWGIPIFGNTHLYRTNLWIVITLKIQEDQAQHGWSNMIMDDQCKRISDPTKWGKGLVGLDLFGDFWGFSRVR